MTKDIGNTVAAALANTMQLRTRQERNFDEVESQLPNPKFAPGPPVTQLLFNATNVLSYLGSRNPLGKPVGGGDVVWLLDNTAFKHHRIGSWQAEFVAAVFEREPKCTVIDIVSGIASVLGIADGATERKTIEERLMPFLWDIRPARSVRLQIQEKELKLGPTGPNGVSSDVLKVPDSPAGELVTSGANVPRKTTGILEMKTYYAAPEGWGIISDVDDTIKITQTSDPTGILRETFVEEPRAIRGMPELYRAMQSWLPRESPWFYLSASPYNLYPFLRDFRDQYYPHGTIILRDASWKTIAGLLSALTLGTEEYKVDRIAKIHSWLPRRKMIVIGDSTQSDPEAYGDIYRKFPGWIKAILIRKATDIAAVGIQEKNEPERFEKAFEKIPREDWMVFEEPEECERFIQDIIARG